ncbi:SIS domain-containing protein [Lichenihabitans sp. Uapishka_5]|uniref:SIS domain-containing protein n=1 Tax=Lichenihabitans sp. Uapishka_5 TaxID=3037302 RepID=UPI0029E7FD32|nr:SIS domain-containing protein [Lichenihabitans sp. Uapishka_5]MDX7951352.1 SIS domain-containing protein [Lichenihabitans sp. Uapishka_5]
MPTNSLMRQEVLETPAAVERLLKGSRSDLRAAGDMLRELDPKVVATIARGSSDHAATFFKYAVEMRCGIPVASLGPSLASVYGARLRLAGAAAVAISQSGRSPDIVALLKAARDGGAETIALVNAPGSPLGAASARELSLQAGPERSVAATKSFVCSIVAALALLGHWSGDEALLAALQALPSRLDEAARADWSAAIEPCAKASSLYTVGRGPGFAIAAEAALKFKEVAILHAECFSGAEIVHGPVSLVEPGFPVLAFLPDDAARPGLQDICRRLHDSGATLLAVGGSPVGTILPHASTGHPLTEPLSMILSFYAFVEGLAQAKDLDPDTPRGLKKVTETV